MASATSQTPWHQVVQVRDDLKTGELSLAVFAADLYDVIMQKGQRRVYEDPAEFFALTYPTLNLRDSRQGRGTTSGRQQRQGVSEALSQLRRRQDPYPNHAQTPRT